MTSALVVDDNVQNLRVLVQLLARQGVQSTEVADPRKLVGAEGSVAAVDVVFLDLEMPGMNGYQVKELLKPHLGDVPIIAYTVHANEINAVREAGFDGLLGKPLDKSRFPEQLARIMRRESVWERNLDD
ncbi:MAG: response regulator [Anaerolineae bacterium]|nr:response regulator [Anaerolineae bacterium]